MSRSVRLPSLVLVSCCLAFAAYVALSVPHLPERMATHFNIHGIPDGWMTRSKHAWGMIKFGIGVPTLIVVMFSLVRRSGGAFCNLPNRDYWLAPERRQQTLDFLLTWSMWLASGLVVFAASLHALISTANQQTPVRLPPAASGWAIGSVLAGVLISIVVLLIRFLRSPDHESKA